MILITFLNRINKHRKIYTDRYGVKPDKVIMSVDAVYMLKNKMLVEMTEIDGDLFFMGMLIIIDERLSQYDFLLK